MASALASMPCPGGNAALLPYNFFTDFSVIRLQDKAEISNTSEIFYTCLVTEYLKCMISTRIDYLEPDPEEAGWLGNCLNSLVTFIQWISKDYQ